MLLLLEHPIYQMFKGAADELKVDVNNPAAGDFLKVVKRFLSAATSSSRMGDNILRHLEMGIRKPRTMTPQRFLLRFSAMLKQAQYFEGIKPMPTDEEQKDWYFRAYPKSYRLDYKKMHDDRPSGPNRNSAASLGWGRRCLTPYVWEISLFFTEKFYRAQRRNYYVWDLVRKCLWKTCRSLCRTYQL